MAKDAEYVFSAPKNTAATARMQQRRIQRQAANKILRELNEVNRKFDLTGVINIK